MLYCDVGTSDSDALDTLAVAVCQLRRNGIEAVIAAQSVPAGLNEHQNYLLSLYTTARAPAEGDAFALFNAHQITGDKLSALHRVRFPAGMQAHAFGLFETDQADIQTRARLSYVFGADPLLHPHADSAFSCAPVFGRAAQDMTAPTGPLRLLLVAPDLEDTAVQRAIFSLAAHRQVRVALLVSGKAKQNWLARFGTDIAVFHYTETLPAHLADRMDICAICEPVSETYRLATLFAELGGKGGPLLDCTRGHGFARAGERFLPGPAELSLLAEFVKSEILPNWPEISALTRKAALPSLLPAEIFTDQRSPAAPSRKTPQRPIVFMPTNGVGLGHAQRCSLIASEIDSAAHKPVFAAFPSCMRKIKDAGFDVMPLISRAEVKTTKYAFDLFNRARLRALCETAGGFVFDGGYIFNSVYHTILERGLPSVWIRRGLWQANQNNTIALDREKIFDGVIVPTEAFPELNADYSRGSKVHKVGPIVDQVALTPEETADLRASLARRFGRPFDKLVVTMLGGGVAADRRAQTQAICAEMERRPDVLHLVIVWPTALVDPAWFGWKNTRIVKTHRASVVAAASDLFISAVGYNSFHEVLYNAIPTLFIAQMNSYMDDQVQRARSAVERGAAELVGETELQRLSQRIAWILDHDGADSLRAAIADLDLPTPGNQAAAALIEEICNG